jgi:hypothetical protein
MTRDSSKVPQGGWRDFIKVHPAAELFPMMTDGELKELGEDIKANGLQVPIELYVDENYELMVLDGRNRLDAMEAIGYRFAPPDNASSHGHPKTFAPTGETKYMDWRFRRSAPIAHVASFNIHRRHLTAALKTEIIEKLLKAKPERSDRATAKLAKVSDKTVGKVRERLEAGAEIPHLEKRVGSDGKSQPTTKPKGVVPLDDPARPRNRDGGPVSEERAQAAQAAMKIIGESLPKIIGESLPRGAAKEAEAADPLDSLKTAFLALDGRASSYKFDDASVRFPPVCGNSTIGILCRCNRWADACI